MAASGPIVGISPDLARGIDIAFANQGGGRAQEMKDILSRAAEISTISLENAIFTQETVQLNEGGATASLGGSGTEYLGDGGAVVGFMRVYPADISKVEFKAPTGSTLTLDMTGDATLAMDSNLSVTGVSVINQDVSTTGAVVHASITLGATTLVSSILDEDDLVSDSATALATQQSIKAFVASQIGANNELSEILANGNTTGANDLIVTSGQKITTNTIDETTASAGVTIEDLKIENQGAYSDLLAGSGTALIEFNRYSNDISITPDNSGFTQGNLFIDPTEADIAFGNFNTTGHGISIQAAGITFLNANTTTFRTASASIGFYGTAPATQPTLITQTFATASTTHAARTAATLTDNGGGAAANGTIDAIADIALSTGDTYTDAAVNTAVNALVTDTKDAVKELSDQVNKLIADQTNTAQVLNETIDGLESLGLRA